MPFVHESIETSEGAPNRTRVDGKKTARTRISSCSSSVDTDDSTY